MRSRLALPAPLSFAPFRTSEALDAGVPPSRLRHDDLDHPFRGLNIPGAAPRDPASRAEALLPLFRSSDAFSHTTAAALWGVPLPASRDSRLHVTSVDAAGRFRRPGVVGHRSSRLAVTLLRGLPVVEPPQVFRQLATMLAHDDLVAAGDFLVTPRRVDRRPALTTVDELRRAISDKARGAARARRALADVRVGAESRMETLLRLLLIRSGLAEPALNPAIDLGAETYHPDLFYAECRLAIEYLGDQHRTDPREWSRDIRRRESFEDGGYRVIAATRYDLAEPQAFLARVCRAMAQQVR